ncbi:hypothetical protein FFM54_23670 [Burkholderia pseudomallei]|nr:hypothetical protein FFM54_23670 [Burkholderia pseudomallei]RXS78701.1 hypothetical protein C2U63_19285 [Burkholderia pseudomallei]
MTATCAPRLGRGGEGDKKARACGLFAFVILSNLGFMAGLSRACSRMSAIDAHRRARPPVSCI